MSTSKKFICKGTLQQVFFRVYSLEIQSVMLVFDPALWTVAPLNFSLVQLFPLPPFPVWINILYTRIYCLGGGGGMVFLVSDSVTNSLYRSNFLWWRHFALPSMSIIFLRISSCVRLTLQRRPVLCVSLILFASVNITDRARICRPFKEPRNRFPAWRACTTTLFVVTARQCTRT